MTGFKLKHQLALLALGTQLRVIKAVLPALMFLHQTWCFWLIVCCLTKFFQFW